MRNETHDMVPPVAERSWMSLGRSLWKIRRCLAWYGLDADGIAALEVGEEGMVRAAVQNLDGGTVVTAQLDRRTGRLALKFDETNRGEHRAA